MVNRVMSDSVKSLKCPFSCKVHDTLCQGFCFDKLCTEALRLLNGMVLSARAYLFHIFILPTLMIAASLGKAIAELRRRSPSLRSAITGSCGFVILFCTPFGRIGCQQSRAANQESKASGTCGRRWMPDVAPRGETSRNVDRVPLSYNVRTWHPRRSDISVFAWDTSPLV